jgi:ferritin
MEIKTKVRDALNTQINKELYSSYLYLSMSAWFESKNFKGFSHWMKMQAKEELSHAMKIFDYIFERGGDVKLTEIEAPAVEWKSPLNSFEDAYKHEQEVTRMIENLVDIAREEKDKATESFLKWFIDEQVEEEDSARTIVEQLKMIGESKNGLLMLDSHLSKRKGGD